MEDTLGANTTRFVVLFHSQVLILVLMEDTLGEIGKIKPAATLVS